jgi:hypothetical protein
MSVEKDSEAIVFAQVDANLDSNPKIRKAGSFGRQVFEFLLRRNALRGFKGSVPAAFADPDYLADQLMVSRDDAVTGVTKAVTANLITFDHASGVVRIVGWHESWGRRAKEGKERTREWRDRKRAEGQLAVTAGDDGDETPSQVTVRDESDAKRREEKRDPDALPARAIGPSTAAYDPESPSDRRRLAERTYTRVAALRSELIAEFNLRNEIAMPTQITAAEPIGFRDLRQRIQAEGAIAPRACERVIETLYRQAREERSVHWLSDKGFGEGAWSTARNGGGAAKRQQRAGPRPVGTIGSATPRTDHGEDSKPAREVL